MTNALILTNMGTDEFGWIDTIFVSVHPYLAKQSSGSVVSSLSNDVDPAASARSAQITMKDSLAAAAAATALGIAPGITPPAGVGIPSPVEPPNKR